MLNAINIVLAFGVYYIDLLLPVFNERKSKK